MAFLLPLSSAGPISGLSLVKGQDSDDLTLGSISSQSLDPRGETKTVKTSCGPVEEGVYRGSR